MSFLESQETLTALEWVLRAIIAFFFLFIVARALGQRAISQLRVLDFVIALVIGNIIAHPLSDEKLGLKGSLITTVVLVSLYLVGVFSLLKFPRLRRILNPAPIIIVKNGDILFKNLNKARISIDILLEELRERKVDDVKKVALAIWEADGKISVFIDPQFEPVTPSNLQVQTEPFDLPKTIIKEGKINYKELQNTQWDESQVIMSLKNIYQTRVENVLLGTLDSKGNFKIFLYK